MRKLSNMLAGMTMMILAAGCGPVDEGTPTEPPPAEVQDGTVSAAGFVEFYDCLEIRTTDQAICVAGCIVDLSNLPSVTSCLRLCGLTRENVTTCLAKL